QLSRRVDEQTDITAHGDESGAQLQAAARQLLIGGQDAGGLVRCNNAADGLFDSFQYIRMVRVAAVSHVGGQISRADEHAAHAFDGKNIVQRLYTGHRLDLQQQADLLVRRAQVIRVCV